MAYEKNRIKLPYATKSLIEGDLKDLLLENEMVFATDTGKVAIKKGSDIVWMSNFDGDYESLAGKPTIPTKTSDLTNDSGYLTSHQDISGKEDKSNKATSLSSPDNTRYPTTKAVKDAIDNALGSVMTYKGSVANMIALNALTGMEVGDFYNVTDSGINYAWSGSEWDEVGGITDLSGLVPNTRKINGYALSQDRNLDASDVGARPDNWLPTKADIGLENAENKSSATIRGEITKANIEDKLIGTITSHTHSYNNLEDKPSFKTINNESIVGSGNINVSGSEGGEVDLNEMAYFDYAGRIYGAKYSLLLSAWEHSLTVDPLEISATSTSSTKRGLVQYPNNATEGIIIPHGVTSVGNNAFYITNNDHPLVIPNSVTSIGNGAFFGWTANNQPLVIPDSVMSIGDNAFDNWYANKQPLMIGNSITSIGYGAFSKWSSNNQPLVIPDSVTSIGNIAFGYWTSNNQSLVIPNSVTSIGNNAFRNWTANKQPLVIGNSVTSIGFQAFNNWEANNQPLTIPNSVTSIGNNAFSGWLSAKEFIMESETPPTLAGSNAFANQNDAPIYVPDKSVDDYKTATNWSALSSRIFPISEKDKTIEDAPDSDFYVRSKGLWYPLIKSTNNVIDINSGSEIRALMNLNPALMYTNLDATNYQLFKVFGSTSHGLGVFAQYADLTTGEEYQMANVLMVVADTDDPIWVKIENDGEGGSGIVKGTVATAAATVAKTTTIANYTLKEGDLLAITFALGNTASSPTLNINGGGAVPIKLGGQNPTGAANTGGGYIAANGVVLLYYDGTNFNMTGSNDAADTTYSAMTQAEFNTGTATTGRTVSAKFLKDNINTMIDTAIITTINGGF